MSRNSASINRRCHETDFQRFCRLFKRATRRFINRHIAKLVFIGLPLLGVIAGIFIGMRIETYKRATTMNDYGRERRYVSYEIKSGDSLWSIASDLAPLNPEYNDIRQYIYDIKEINGLYSDNIRSGHYIILPYYAGGNGVDVNTVYDKYGICQ